MYRFCDKYLLGKIYKYIRYVSFPFLSYKNLVPAKVKVFQFDTSLCKFYINRNMVKNTPINNKVNPEMPADSLIASSFGFFSITFCTLADKT